MDSGSASLLLAFVVLIGAVTLANLADRRPPLRPLVHIVLLVMNLMFLAVMGSAPARVYFSHGDPTLVMALAALFAGLATVLLLTPVRRRIAVIFPGQFEGTGGFNSDSMVHMTALIYCVYLLGDRALEYVIAGGMTGLAENFTAPTVNSLWIQMVIFVGFAAFGVGLGTRRRLTDTVQRLGLRAPTLAELGTAAASAFLLYCAVFVIGNFWQSVTPSEVIREQTRVSELLSNSIGTLMMGLLVAGTAAIGEEIAFRGALQPVFGLWPTAIFFALVHIQYTLTPATLIIIVVAVGFGWLRRRYNTTTSMVAHFLYDFGLIAITIYGRYLIDMLGVRQ